MVSANRLAANRRSLASAIGAGIITPGASGGGSTVRRMMGFGGDHGAQTRISDGTKNTFNTRTRFYTPIPIPNPEVVYSGFVYNSGAEYDTPNDVTYHSAIELPDGSITDVGASVTVAPGTVIAKSGKMQGFTIPAGSYWIRTSGKVATGGKWYYTDVFRSTNVGNMEEGTDLVDKAASGTIGNASQQLPMAAIGVIGDAPLSHRLFGLTGDSISIGVGGYSNQTAPSLARGILAGLVLARGLGSVVQMGRAGASAAANIGNYAKRTAFMLAVGVTDLLCDLGINDMSSTSSAATLKTNLTTFLGAFRSAMTGVRIFQSTLTPSTTATAPITESNQTLPTPMQDGRRLTFNADLRAGGLSTVLTGVVEFAVPAQLDADANLWKAGYASDAGSPGAQQHPNQTGGEAIVAYAAAQNSLALAA